MGSGDSDFDSEIKSSQIHPATIAGFQHMKTSSFLLIGLYLVMTAGCATHRAPSSQPRPAANVVSPAADLLIISAVYGSGKHYADVTYRVNDLIHQPNVEFFARPEWLKQDPTPGWNKALVVVYEFKGKRTTFACGEGGRVTAEILIATAQE